MLTIDGAIGEGGGQILRTSLALSLCLNKPFRIKNIRVKRRKPGLAWQHLAAVKAAQQVGLAEVEGATHGSTSLVFSPQKIQHGNFQFDIGTAGSTSLVLQTVLPALLFAKQSSSLTITGGTHNPFSPSYDFLAKVFFPLLKQMGAKINAELIRPGFFPHGGGLINAQIHPAGHLEPLELKERGHIIQQRATVQIAGLPRHIAEREIDILQQDLQLGTNQVAIEELASEFGPGNIVMHEVQSEHLTELFTAYGQKRVRAESVASGLVTEVKHYLNARVPVGYHLADQLLLPLALAGSGCIVTQPLSSHSLTNIEIIKQFMPIKFNSKRLAESACELRVENP